MIHAHERGYYEDVMKKIKSFSHGEFNNPLIVNENTISQKINKGIDIFNRNIEYKKVDIDNSFPEYIYSNVEKFKKWII